MKIIWCATSFLPRVGGIENIADMMAQAQALAGDDVTVLTLYDGPPMPERAYRLIRNPSMLTVFRICREADVVIMPNIGLKLAMSVVASGTPLFVWHQHEYRLSDRSDRQQSYPTQLKGLLIKRYVTANFGCSDYITATLPPGRPRLTLLNPYDADVIYEEEGVERDQDILALGRLVDEKGFDVVLRAMALPGGPLDHARLTIVGEGSAEGKLRDLAASLGLSDRVEFFGPARGATIRKLLNAHRILVVPSLWPEPFGIVALEGLAGGCATVVSDVGGLAQAAGTQGRLFRSGDPVDAARALAAALSEPRDPNPAARQAHLARHTAHAVAKEMRRLMVSFLPA